MKPVNREKVLHKDNEIAERKAKQKVFRPKVTRPNKSVKQNKKQAVLPLGAKIGAGAAGIALVGGSVASIAHNMSSDKGVQNPNSHSSDNGLNFSKDNDSSDKRNNRNHKLRNNEKDPKKGKKSRKGQNILDDLLEGKASKTKLTSESDDDSLYPMINGVSDSKDNLKNLASKANRSIKVASGIGSQDSKKDGVKGKTTKATNTKDKNGITNLSYKPKGNKEIAGTAYHSADRANQLGEGNISKPKENDNKSN